MRLQGGKGFDLFSLGGTFSCLGGEAEGTCFGTRRKGEEEYGMATKPTSKERSTPGGLLTPIKTGSNYQMESLPVLSAAGELFQRGNRWPSLGDRNERRECASGAQTGASLLLTESKKKLKDPAAGMGKGGLRK